MNGLSPSREPDAYRLARAAEKRARQIQRQAKGMTMDGDLLLTQRVALAGEPILSEDIYEVTDAGAAYLDAHALDSAPLDPEAA